MNQIYVRGAKIDQRRKLRNRVMTVSFRLKAENS